MKRFKILIEETNVDDEFTPIEGKRFQIDYLQNEALCDEMLPIILDEKWPELRDYFLKERNNVPFHKIRRLEVDCE